MNQFRNNILNPLKFRIFKLQQLPLAYMAGLKVKELTDDHSKIQIKHNHWTKNPFKSMYFAAQAMAAELSTGLLVMDKVQQLKPKKISMLVLNMEAEFTKKATGTIHFVCQDGHILDEVFQKIINSKEGEIITLNSVGIDEQNDIVSNFKFTWTLKQKV